MPKPGIAALPQASAGSATSVPVASAPRPGPRPPPDRRPSAASTPVPTSAPAGSGRSPKGRARPTMVIASPGSRRASRYRRRPPALDREAAGGWPVPDRGRGGASAIAASRSGSPTRTLSPVRIESPGGSSPSVPVALVEPDRCVDPGAAREDPQRARRVADPEPDRPFLRVTAVARRAVVVSVVDGRAVVDARHALEERDEDHLGRFDDAAEAHLAGRDRADRRGRGVGDRGTPSGSRPCRARARRARR